MKRGAVQSLPWLAALGLLLGAAVSGWQQPGCPLRAALGIKCPGCGAGRALTALLEGEWRQAWYWNALLWPMLIFLISAGFQRDRGWRTWGLAGAVGLGFGVLRNLPFYLLY